MSAYQGDAWWLGRPYGEVPAVRGSFSVRPPPNGLCGIPHNRSYERRGVRLPPPTHLPSGSLLARWKWLQIGLFWARLARSDLRCRESGTAVARAPILGGAGGVRRGRDRQLRSPATGAGREPGGAGVVAYQAGAVSCRKAARIADSSCGHCRLGRCPARGSSTGRAPDSRAARRGRDQPEVEQAFGPDTTRAAEPQRRAAASAAPAV